MTSFRLRWAFSPDAPVARQITAPAVMQVADYYLRSATWRRFRGIVVGMLPDWRRQHPIF